ncbi:MAG: endonuclease [Prevotellaceae bacterium]|jgi:endonuclease I|nr:endonuclease [Prevotellaceae bacterium]
MKNKYILNLLFCALISINIFAQPSANYYNSANGLTEGALKTALYQIIKNPGVTSYAGLWNSFEQTDKKPDGTVWDMYSNCTFHFGVDQDFGVGGSAECQYFNREHSFPKSWFNDETPMYSDLFHLYPTDKYVNGQRGNLPFGETANPTNTYGNGSKRGNSSFAGYSGTVFEPIDTYKGDFARTYFYMVTCYENIVKNWNSEHLAGNSYPALNTWSVNLLLKWHRQDPVSQKETDRNNAVENIQHNRNPFIDRPELAEYIWGNKKGEAWNVAITQNIDIQSIPLNIIFNNENKTVQIVSEQQFNSFIINNLNGQIIEKGNIENNVIKLKTSAKGLYFITLNSENVHLTKKLVIN